MTAQQPSPVAETESGASGSPAPEKKTSRAGRDLPAAIAVGVVLGAMAIPVLVLGLFWGPIQSWAQAAFKMWVQ